jgi:hypothetical protein
MTYSTKIIYARRFRKNACKEILNPLRKKDLGRIADLWSEPQALENTIYRNAFTEEARALVAEAAIEIIKLMSPEQQARVFAASDAKDTLKLNKQARAINKIQRSWGKANVEVSKPSRGILPLPSVPNSSIRVIIPKIIGRDDPPYL